MKDGRTNTKRINSFPGQFMAALFFVVFAMALSACDRGTQSTDSEDPLLARVYDLQLHLSDMEGMIPEGMSSEDSLLIIQAFVQNWIKEAVLLHEAERHIPEDLDIDKLVADYRASLIRNSYENFLVEEMLDSTISAEELHQFYEANKEQYKLETPIIRCRFIKVKKSTPGLNQATNWWNSQNEADLAKLRNWARQNAELYRLDDKSWYKVEEIAAFMPKGILTIDNVNSRRDFIQRDDEYQYFFKVLELVSRPETAPLAYIEEQARKVILHKRKSQLLEDVRNRILDEALKAGEVEKYYEQ